MKNSLKGKTALVTGSTSGLGQGIAEALAAEGCHVMLTGFGDPPEIETLRGELAKKYGIRAVYHHADLANPAEIRALMAQTENEFGTIDVLVNNAGFQHVSPIEEFPEERWNAMLAVNLSAAFHTTKAVLPGMRARKWGRIINIASVHGLVASPFKSAYVATKHGLVGLSKVTALETARDGITCNAICPGYVKTAVVHKQIDQQALVMGIPRERVIEEVILAKHPNKEFVEIEHVAAYVIFLCSEAGSSTTGAAIAMDGGWSTI